MAETQKFTLKLFLLAMITAKRQLSHDKSVSENKIGHYYDFIIVGGGTAGCTVANRLSENSNINVLLIEAGGEQSATFNDIPAMVSQIFKYRRDINWYYKNEPQKNVGKKSVSGLKDTTAKVLGGSSTHNGMVFNRGNKHGYNDWSKTYGAHNWSFEEILPYFKMFENNTDKDIVRNNPKYHGTVGPVQVSTIKDPPKYFQLFEDAFKEYGFKKTDFNGPDQIGYSAFQQTITSKGLRASNANAYVDPNPHPDNLYISTDSLVTKIIFDNITAIGVEFTKYNKTHRIYARKEVIITAGAYKTPQILMLSGVGIKSHLQELKIPVILDLPVGDHFKNHPITYLRAKYHPHVRGYHTSHAKMNSETLSQLYLNKTGSLAQFPVLGLYFNTENNKPGDWPNGLLQIYSYKYTVTFGINLVRIKGEGKIRLKSRDILKQPVIDPNFLGDAQDFKDMVNAIKFLYRLMNSTSLAIKVDKISFRSHGCPDCGDKNIDECTENIECLIDLKTETSSHPCCSCRMGDIKRDDVVVDPFLKVKNAKQLRICDASVFPDIPNSNTNAPTNMVAEKCASMIKAEHRF